MSANATWPAVLAARESQEDLAAEMVARTVVGFSGHQALSDLTSELIRGALQHELAQLVPLVGLTSLAAGADQIFAQCVLDLGGELSVIVPSKRYEETFASPDDLANYRRLLSVAASTVELNHSAPSEAAYWDAGRHVVEQAKVLVAVWDGLPAAGLGGTADVVKYATELGREVIVVWPTGAARQ
jgi:hypothetical protein